MLQQSALGEEQISREWATIFKQFLRFEVLRSYQQRAEKWTANSGRER
jgi:hypothetical protein